MHSVDKLMALVESEIDKFKLPTTPCNLYDPIGYTLQAGGKRIRPLMVLIAANMFNDDVSDAIAPALAIEIFHNFTLLHDDIMDNAAMRRGRKSVHKKWNTNVAILSGDVMMIEAYAMLSRCKVAKFHNVLDSFNKLARLVCEGQQYDMDFETQTDVTIEEYINMITLKTSALIAGAIEIGALCGGAEIEVCEQLYQFGENLGIAFQLQDDLLDTYGCSKTFGKKIGSDILEGKKTFLMLSLLKLATDDQKREITSILSSNNLDEQIKIDGIKAMYGSYNIKELTEKEIDLYYKKAIEIVDNINIEPEKKESMYDLASRLLKRKK